MASDFYLKTQTLYEEFKKKELCYLDGEQKLNDTLMWKRDHNVPFQEYLQKIRQREKKNEETYQSIMKQMNELDQRTDLLFSKIDKLSIFRDIQAGCNLNDTNYSLTSRYISPSLNAIQNFKTEPIAFHFESKNLKSSTLKYASTQTENNIYCDNCKSLIQISSQSSQLQNSTSSTIDILSVSKDDPQIIDSSRLQTGSFSFFNESDINSQLNESSEKTVHVPPQTNDNCRSLIQISSQPNQIQNSTSPTMHIVSVSKDESQILDSSKMQNDSFSGLSNNNNYQFNKSFGKINHDSSQVCENEKCLEKKSENELQTIDNDVTKFSTANAILEQKQISLKSNEGLVDENAPKDSVSQPIILSSQSKSNESEINTEVSKHKSDADSVNQEFDFLESDAAHLTSKVKIHLNSKNIASQSADINQTANLNGRLHKSSVKFEGERDTFQPNKEQDISDNRSETSGNVSGNRSPIISLSDSDSMNEKGSFTTSAAYQSLLGNTVIPSKVYKQVSESDSEDEVEKALSSAVKKSNIKTKSSSQPKKDKGVSQSHDSKPAINKPKSVTMNKPQSKLSKNTKKVLGIDTSSSSEIEMSLKPSKNKKDEDSDDEFDFYD